MQQSSYEQLITYIDNYRKEVNNAPKYALKHYHEGNAKIFCTRSYFPFYKKSPNETLLNELVNQCAKVQSPSQQDIANVVGCTYNLCLYDLTLALIELWQKEIDINIPSDTFEAVLIGKEIMENQIDMIEEKYPLNFVNIEEATDDHVKLYKFVTNKFKHAIHRSTSGRGDRKNIYARNIITKIINHSEKKPVIAQVLTLVLLDFFEAFKTDIDTLAKADGGDNHFDLCVIKVDETDTCKHNKNYIREMLKKYYPEKLKLSIKSTDCFFTYKKYYDTTH